MLVSLAPSYARTMRVRSTHKQFHIRAATAEPAFFGWASWYGPEMHARKMANGERFNPHKYTAASLSLPLGAEVRVFNIQTAKAVEVTITDRGPYVHGRILDLAQVAADEIGCRGLCVVVISSPEELELADLDRSEFLVEEDTP